MEPAKNTLTPDPHLITTADVTVENLESFLYEAYFNVQKDDDGDLFIQEPYKVWIEPSKNGRRIRLLAVFGVSQTTTFLDQLEYVNRINDDLVVIRAALSGAKKDAIAFTYFIPVEGGITKRAVVFAIKSFFTILADALHMDEGGVIG